ncbi:MAG: LysR substrate-binding domain-containing protein [Rhodocyclaceae bacterium]|jgi:DNA-binding transcriptional LysR family regulator
MDVRHLKYFVAVAEELSFSRAAERLHISQPPLSLQIHALEEELGTELFVRTSRKVALTDAGKKLLLHARRILADIDRAMVETRRVGRGELGELRIGFSASLPFTSFLPRVLREYGESHPEVDVQLSSMMSAEQFEAILRGRLDIGLLRYSGLGAPAGIELHEIARDSLRVVVNTKHRLAGADAIALADLRDEGFITYPYHPDAGFNMHEYQLCLAAGFEPRIVQEAREATTQIGLVAAGFGVALLPEPLACVHIEGVRYIPLRDPGAHMTLAAAVRTGKRSRLAADFLALILAGRAREAS